MQVFKTNPTRLFKTDQTGFVQVEHYPVKKDGSATQTDQF
jgi:hypothetical protein